MPAAHMLPATRHMTVARSLVGRNSVTRDVVTGKFPDGGDDDDDDYVGGERGAGRRTMVDHVAGFYIRHHPVPQTTVVRFSVCSKVHSFVLSFHSLNHSTVQSFVISFAHGTPG